jgi:hypothetical protein
MKKSLSLIVILCFIVTNYKSVSAKTISKNYNTDIPILETEKSNKSYYDALIETVMIDKIKNPFIIKHLFKNAYKPIMSQITSMIIMHDQGKNVIPQIDSIKNIISTPKFILAVMQADLLQIELNKLEKEYNKLPDSEKAELINPTIIDPYDSIFKNIKERIMIYSRSHKK